jgi:hypothetical protein
MVRPSAWAVFRLITSSNVVGCSMGRSAGLAPLGILDGQTSSELTLLGKSVGHPRWGILRPHD